MTKRLALIVALAAVLLAPALVAPVAVAPLPNPSIEHADGLVAHEWGTFTSIAGEDGRAVQWLPQAGPSDLPNFVGRIACSPRLKSSLAGMVRMETPVIYFYVPRELTVNVSVRFRQGIITEWFPKPAGLSDHATTQDAFEGDIAWRSVRVDPGGRTDFRVERQPGHYYIARETDAAPLQVGAEHERFLFYRGVGRLPPPIAATVSGNGQIVVRHTRRESLGDVMLFENRDGATSFQMTHTRSAEFSFTPRGLEKDAPSPEKQLEEVLVAHGLYPREATAMVDSWEGSWFEHGTRLFYIVSNEMVDALLPLQIDPKPVEVRRVFVGRLEIATRKTLSEVRAALEHDDRGRLAQYGRFLEPFAKRLFPDLSVAERSRLQSRMDMASMPWSVPASCQSTTD
jgi:hypothetical protein